MPEVANSENQPFELASGNLEPVEIELTIEDFINAYADYADVLEAPRIQHEMMAMQLVASVLNRNGVTIPWGAVRYSMDLWALLLSGSGAGRSTTVSLTAPILERLGMRDLERSVVWGSAPSFYQDFSENPSGLFVWGEMAERLQLLNQPNFATVKPWLTDRYDNFAIPDSFRYRRTGNAQDTPPIEFHKAPRTNILATSSEDWFFRNLAETDSAGGFLARWVIVRQSYCNRDVPIPNAPDASLLSPLVRTLAEIADLNSEADLSRIEDMYKEWYGAAKRRFREQPNRDLAIAYFNRHRGHILKLATIFEASQSRTLKVSPEAFKRAVAFGRRIERTIFELLPTGMSAIGYELRRMERLIRDAGPNGFARNRLTRAFQSMKPNERDQLVRTLYDSGAIFPMAVSTKGRTKTVYVHAVFRDHKQVQTGMTKACEVMLENACDNF